MFIKGIAIFLQFILLQSANEIKAKRATLFLLLGHPPVNVYILSKYIPGAHNGTLNTYRTKLYILPAGQA